MNKVVLKPKRDFSVRKHHPWIFSGAILSEAGSAGETVEVTTAGGETLGYGSYSPLSQIRVRMLSFDPKAVPDDAFIDRLVAASVIRRLAFLSGGSTTTACRVINAENDDLPGVVVDFYAGWAVCQLTSAGAVAWKKTIVSALMRTIPGCRGVAERTDVDAREKEGLASDEADSFHVLAGDEPPALIEISEGDIRYFVDVRKGHKTGFYLDQRDARKAVSGWAKGRTVLNCFSYTGGFGLAAAVGGAKHVTQVDVSREALALAHRNAALMGVSACVEEVEADVFQYLRACRDSNKRFDLIVLDPPKFAASKGQLMKAARGYKDINLLAMKLLNPDGVLATFSCSGAMTGEFFDRILSEAAADSKYCFQVVGKTRAGVDHPVSLAFPEGAYLKGVILQRKG